MRIEALLNSLGTAAQEAYGDIEAQNLMQFLENYFERSVNGSGDVTYTPKLIQVEIPSIEPGKGDKQLSVPLAALVHHNKLNLENVKIKLNIGVTEEANGGLQVSPQGAPAQDDDAGSKQSGTIEINFKCADTSEGISRIETHLNGML